MRQYDIKNLIKDYNHMTNKAIMKKHNICRGTLYNILKRNNIPLKCRIPFITRTYTNQQILYGSLLGDGHISKINMLYTETHGIAQELYLKLKNNYLNIRFKCYIRKNRNNNKMFYVYSARNDPWTIELRELFYPNNKKIVTKQILDKIDELGLLVWYLDDGCLADDNHTELSTLCFTYDEHLVMQKWFKSRWNIDVTIRPINKKLDGGNWLYFPVKSTRRLLSILKPVFKDYGLPKCMKYKLWRE